MWPEQKLQKGKTEICFQIFMLIRNQTQEPQGFTLKSRCIFEVSKQVHFSKDCAVQAACELYFKTTKSMVEQPKTLKENTKHHKIS